MACQTERTGKGESKMKRNAFIGILLALAVVIAAGSVTVLGPCIHEDGSEAVCTQAGRAIMADGIVMILLTVLMLCIRRPGVRIFLLVLTLAASAAGMLMPGTLLPICKVDTMHCRAVMRPAMIVLFDASALISVCGIITEKLRNRRNKP